MKLKTGIKLKCIKANYFGYIINRVYIVGIYGSTLVTSPSNKYDNIDHLHSARRLLDDGLCKIVKINSRPSLPKWW